MFFNTRYSKQGYQRSCYLTVLAYGVVSRPQADGIAPIVIPG